MNNVSAYCMKSHFTRNLNVGLIRRVLSWIMDSDHRPTNQQTVCTNVWARGNKFVHIKNQRVLRFKRLDKIRAMVSTSFLALLG